MYSISKDYLEREYHNAVLDFELSVTDDERFACHHRIAQLERTAMEQYGFDFADYLHSKYICK